MSFLPKDFEVPATVETGRFRMRSITVDDVFKDYDAVMSSRTHLWQRFGDVWGWPREDLTIEQNIVDLGWHQKEFQLRSSFDYAVMALDDSRLLGCVYVDPPHEQGTDADVWFWARQSELSSGLEDFLEEFLRSWLEARWPFATVTLNGRRLELDDLAGPGQVPQAARREDASGTPGVFPLEGGCDCRQIRYRMLSAPLFVHCCHCRWCQRESGSSFALNAMIEADQVESIAGDPEIVHTPSESGYGQDIARCPTCRIAVWSHYAGAGPSIRFVRVGTLDQPDRLPPDIHIFTASRQPWVIIPPGARAVPEYYDREQCWPAASLARRAALLPRIEAYRAALRRG